MCGIERPLDQDNFRLRLKDGKESYTAECKACIKKAKALSRLRAEEKRQQALTDIEKAGVDVFLKGYSQGGTAIPHTAELVEHVFRYFGGVGGFSAVLVKQYWDSPSGGTARNRLLETMCRLVTKNVDSGGAKKPLQLWSEEELEQELEQRMAEAVATFKGVTINVEAQATNLIEEASRSESPSGKGAAVAGGGDDTVPKGKPQRAAKRAKGSKARGSKALPSE